MGLLLSREKKKNRVHAVFYGGILLCAFLLQYVPGVLPRVGGSGTPSLMLLAVVAVAMCEGDVRGGAFGLAAPTNPLYLPQATLRECAALVKDFLVGNL